VRQARLLNSRREKWPTEEQRADSKFKRRFLHHGKYRYVIQVPIEAESPVTGIERQNLSCLLDRSQENPLGVASWKSLVIEPDLRCSKHGDQWAIDRTK
jgi:hypothetical protein